MSLKISSGWVVTTDHKRISYDHYQNGHHRIVIIAPGFFNSKKAVLLKELGKTLSEKYDVIIMDFRGHGQSRGSFSWTSKEYWDLLAVVDYAKSQSRRIAVVGFSLGAVVAIITASKSNHIRSLISISAPTELGKIDYQFWRLDIENDIFYNLLGEGKVGKGIRLGPFWLKKEKPVRLIKGITIPMLFIHGEADWIIRPWHAQVLYREANSPKRLVMIKNGPHAEYLLRKNKDEVIYWIKKWLDETIEGLF